MTTLTEFCLDAVYFPRSPWTVVRWWEQRRLAFNAAVGAAGIVTLGVCALLIGLPPLQIIVPFVLGYALVANLCYSVGALADLAARRIGGLEYAVVGPTLFRYGFVFSVGLTLLPIPVMVIGWTLRMLFGHHGAGAT
jgi:hypothetical protein